MQAVAIESFQELNAGFIWPALLHSVWIGLVAASVSALILQAAGRLSHGARHAILLGAFALVCAGPAIATVLQRSNSARAPAEKATGWVIAVGKAQPDNAHMVQAASSSPMTPRELRAPGSRLVKFAAAWLTSSATFATRVRPFLLTAWFFGVAIFAGFLALGARSVSRVCREAEAAAQNIDERASAMARQLGLERGPPVLVHPRVEEPFLCGIFRPAIILPGRLVASCQNNALEAILAHELAHARRRDQLVNAAQRLVEMLLFFHPAVHWLSRSLRRQREFCADALAIGLTDDPLALAGALESVALLRHSWPAAPAFGSSLGGHSTSLLPRIQELLGMKPSRPRPRFWPFAALPAAGLFALLAASAGMAGDRPPASASRPTGAGNVSARQQNKPMISYEVRWISGLDAEPWRDLLQDRLKLVSQEADVCAWIADDKAIFDLLTLAMAHTMTNVLQAPKAVGEENATVALANVAKQFYVAQVEKVENQDIAGFRPTVKNIEVGVRMELTGALHDGGTKLALSLHDTDLLAMHTLHRKDQVGDRLFKAQYQVPTPVERSCRVACEIPDGSSLLISLGMRERRGRSSDAAETASELLQLVGLPPLPARSVTCERLVCIRPRRLTAPTDRPASKKEGTRPIKPESASRPSPARP